MVVPVLYDIKILIRRGGGGPVAKCLCIRPKLSGYEYESHNFVETHIFNPLNMNNINHSYKGVLINLEPRSIEKHIYMGFY